MNWARLAARAGAMIVRPGRVWDEIGPEPGEPHHLLLGYVVPLAAIPAVCGAIGTLLFGISFADVGVRPTTVSVLLEAVAGYGLTLLVVWLAALWIAVLAPAFGGLRERDQALKLATFSATPMWLAGIAHLYPNLGAPMALLAALYAGWTLYLGLPRMMRSVPGHTLTYFAVVLLGLLVLGVLWAVAVAKAAELGGPLGFS
jgi:Protein of unknown function (DUF1282).